MIDPSKPNLTRTSTLVVLDAIYRERAVYLPAVDALIIADIHLGRATASDVELPLGEIDHPTERLRQHLREVDPEEVVVAGDTLHQFGRLSAGVERGVSHLAAVCKEFGTRLVFVGGNHDSLLEEVWSGTVHEAYRLGSNLIHHGHELPGEEYLTDAQRVLVGHDHPVIRIEGRRRPCFLYGSEAWRGLDLLMLPAFTRLAAGVEVNGMRATDFQSPLVTDVDSLRPVVYDDDTDEALKFPPLGEFRRLL